MKASQSFCVHSLICVFMSVFHVSVGRAFCSPDICQVSDLQAFYLFRARRPHYGFSQVLLTANLL